MIKIVLTALILYNLMSFNHVVKGIEEEQSGRAKEAAAYLNLGVGGRALALGKAFTSVAEDVSALYWNPSGLAQMKKYELQAMSASLGLDRSLYFVGVGIPFKFGTSGLGLDDIDDDPPEIKRRNFFLPIKSWRLAVAFGTVIFRVDNIDRRTSLGAQDGVFTNVEYAYFFSMGHDVLNDLMIGYTFKYHVQRLENSSAKGRGVDFGALYSPDYIPGLKIGLAVQNVLGQLIWNANDAEFGTTDEYEEKILNRFKIGTSYQLKSVPLLFAFETELVSHQKLHYRSGIEFKPLKIISIRAGTDNRSPSAGLGFIQKIGSRMETQVDYAFVSGLGVINQTHRFSLTLRY